MQHSIRERLPLVGATVCGVIHAGFSLYWATGGDNLVDTLGEDIAGYFSDRRWLLAAIGIAKCIAACAPLVFYILDWPYPAVTRGLCWIGASVLILWGGANAVLGNLVLLGLLNSDDEVNLVALTGHAWLWDPLFFLWGMFLLFALVTAAVQEKQYPKAQR